MATWIGQMMDIMGLGWDGTGARDGDGEDGSSDRRGR